MRRARSKDIVAHLNRPASKGVLIVGQRGTGKTWMLAQVLASLEPNSVTVRLSPNKALASVPFGAVNARTEVDLTRSTNYYQVVQGLLDQVQAGFETASSVFLVIDNGEHVDEQSAAVIMQVILTTDAKLVLVEGSNNHQPLLRELWRDGYISRFEMGSLDTRDTRHFLDDVLGGPVAISTAQFLAHRSTGNALVMKGLVAAALTEGSLRKVDGVWMLVRPGADAGPESQDQLQIDLEHLHPESNRIMEILALAGPLPLDLLFDISDADALDGIQQNNLVSVNPGIPMTMALARPGTAGQIRETIPVGRSRVLFDELSNVLFPDMQMEPQTLINLTRWAVDCGAPVDDRRILAAATFANQLVRPPEAQQLSSHPVDDQYASELLAQRSIAHYRPKQTAQARTFGLQSMELATTPAAGAAALNAIHLAFLSSRNYREHFSNALDTYEQKFGAASLTTNSARADIDVLTTLAMSELSLGESAGHERIISLLGHPLTRNTVDQTLLKAMLCEYLSITGKMITASKISAQVIADLKGPVPFPRQDISVLSYARAVSSMIFNGDWEKVQKSLDPELFDHAELMLISSGLKDLAAGVKDIRLGRIKEALFHLIPAVGALTENDPWLIFPKAIGMLAYAQALNGQLEATQMSLARLEKHSPRGAKFHEVEGFAYAAAAAAIAGDHSRGVSQLRGLLLECQDMRWLGLEVVVLSLLIRLNQTDVIPRLGEVAGLIESGHSDFLQAWAAALSSQDPDRLEQFSAQAFIVGFELIAAETAILAQIWFEQKGKLHQSHKAARQVASMLEHMNGLASPVFSSAVKPKLTRREHEIAVMVAQGESNSAIATALGVSLRTVEGHLYRTFIKLNCQSREQLAGMINTQSAALSTRG